MSEPSLDPALVKTDAAKDLLTRPVFAALPHTRPQRSLGGHVAVNAYDLARVEAEAYQRGCDDTAHPSSTPSVNLKVRTTR